MDYDFDSYVERYDEDDLYMYNQNEAADYRHEGDSEGGITCDTCNNEGVEDGCPECGLYTLQEYEGQEREDFGYFGYAGMIED